MKVSDIAKVAHEVNAAYCASQGDTSQKPWDEAPEWQRVSAVNGVIFHRDHPDALPSHSHDSWLKEKVDDGWVYGPVKDADKKTHPCIVPYDELPVEQKAKDYIFKAVVNALIPYLDINERGGVYLFYMKNVTMTVESIAHVAYQVISAYRRSQGDDGYLSWTETPEPYRTGVIDSVLFLLENQYTDPQHTHRLWMAKQLESGWTYGPAYDMTAMTDPQLMPFDELPSTLKTTVYLVVAVVDSLRTFDLEHSYAVI